MKKQNYKFLHRGDRVIVFQLTYTASNPLMFKALNQVGTVMNAGIRSVVVNFDNDPKRIISGFIYGTCDLDLVGESIFDEEEAE